jgi:hypothetical protein
MQHFLRSRTANCQFAAIDADDSRLLRRITLQMNFSGTMKSNSMSCGKHSQTGKLFSDGHISFWKVMMKTIQ